MDYKFNEKVEFLLNSGNHTKKSLYDFLDMTSTGFDNMMKNNSFTAIRLARIAEFFGVEINFFYEDVDLKVRTPKKASESKSFGEEVISTLIGKVETIFEEQLRKKDEQISNLQEMLKMALGKSDGVPQNLVVLKGEAKVMPLHPEPMKKGA